MAFADDQSGKECTQRQADIRQARQRGRPETDGHDGQEEELLTPGLGNLLQEPRNRPTRQKNHHHNQPDGFAESQENLQPTSELAGQDGQKQNHGDNGEILEDQNGQRKPARRRVTLTSLLQKAHDDGGTAQRDQKPDEDPFPDGSSKAQHQQNAGQKGEQDLECSADGDDLADAEELLEAELQGRW